MQAQHKAVMKELRRGVFGDKIDQYLGGTPRAAPARRRRPRRGGGRWRGAASGRCGAPPRRWSRAGAARQGADARGVFAGRGRTPEESTLLEPAVSRSRRSRSRRSGCGRRIWRWSRSRCRDQAGACAAEPARPARRLRAAAEGSSPAEPRRAAFAPRPEPSWCRRRWRSCRSTRARRPGFEERITARVLAQDAEDADDDDPSPARRSRRRTGAWR